MTDITLNRDESVCQKQFIIKNIEYDFGDALEVSLPTEFIVWVDEDKDVEYALDLISSETGFCVESCILCFGEENDPDWCT